MTSTRTDIIPTDGHPAHARYEIVRLSPRRWAVVAAYGQPNTTGYRSGYWAEDADGGWGTSDRSAERAIRQCARPRAYATRRAALAEIAE